MALKLDPIGIAITTTLEAFWGDRFKFNNKHTPVWNHQLADMQVTTEETIEAIRTLVRHHTHGAPYLAEIVREIMRARELREFREGEARANAQLAAAKGAKR